MNCNVLVNFDSYSGNSSPTQGNKTYRNSGTNSGRHQHNSNRKENNYTPPDRFLNRAHLVELKRSPDALCNGSKWDQLSQSVWAKFSSRQQTEETYRKKMYLWRYLYTNIKVSFFLFYHNCVELKKKKKIDITFS